MGTIGRKLYGNDFASDVKNTYETVLALTQDPDKAYKYTIAEYEDEFDDEEPLFWYALADQQLKYGVLNDDVKKKALDWIDRKGGIDCWEEVNKKEKWLMTLHELENELTSNPPPIKKFPRHMDKDIWDIGDVYAIKLEREFFKQFGLQNKYIILVKTAMGSAWRLDNATKKYPEAAELGIKFPVFTIIDGIFDQIPSIDEIEKRAFITILSQFFIPFHKYKSFGIFVSSMRHYPKSILSKIGNMNVETLSEGSPQYYLEEMDFIVDNDFETLDLIVGDYIFKWEAYKNGEEQAAKAGELYHVKCLKDIYNYIKVI